MSVVSKFTKSFDSSNKEHVSWLSRMTDVAEKMADPSQKSTLVIDINTNPMNIKMTALEALEWPQTHFCLCGVYTKAVFAKKAFIPE